MGDMVNLAARLMGAAPPSETLLLPPSSHALPLDDVLVDQQTRNGSHTFMDFETRPDLLLKGMPMPVSNYRPTGAAQQTTGTVC